MAVRIATFNAENIMHRFDFSGYRDLQRRDRALQMVEVSDEDQFRQLEQARIIAHTDDKMQLTALAIAATRADIICLQEIENIEALEAFESGYLARIAGRHYSGKYLTPGNDGRGVDVAVLTCAQTADGDEIEFVALRSHASVTFGELGLHNSRLGQMGIAPQDRLFRRDCLEIDLRIGGHALTLFVVHFKSPGPGRDGVDGRESTMPVRSAEAQAVRMLVARKFGAATQARRRWLICGDLNDYRERLVVDGSHESGHLFSPREEATSGLDSLISDEFCVDLVQRRDRLDRWTLYHYGGPDYRHLCQLDYLLASPALAGKNPAAVPDIIRNGQPWRTPFPPGQQVERYPRIGWDRPKSSDHCPVAVTLNIV